MYNAQTVSVLLFKYMKMAYKWDVVGNGPKLRCLSSNVDGPVGTSRRLSMHDRAGESQAGMQ